LIQEATAAFTPQTTASPITAILWLIPAIPIVASGIIALLKQPRRAPAAALAIGGLAVSLLLSLVAFTHVLSGWASNMAVARPSNSRGSRSAQPTLN